VLVGLANPGHMGNTTYRKSAHLCAEFDQTGILAVLSDIAALDPYGIVGCGRLWGNDLWKYDALVVKINVV